MIKEIENNYHPNSTECIEEGIVFVYKMHVLIDRTDVLHLVGHNVFNAFYQMCYPAKV